MSDRTPEHQAAFARNQFKPGPDARRGVKPYAARNECGKSISKLAREKSVEAVETLIEIMSDPTQRARDRISAANSVLDRAIGKAVSTVKLDAQVNHNHSAPALDIAALPREVRMALIAARDAMSAPPPILIEAHPVAVEPKGDTD